MERRRAPGGEHEVDDEVDGLLAILDVVVQRPHGDAQFGGHDSQAATDGAQAALGASAALAVVAVLTTITLIDPRRVPRPDLSQAPAS